jgi:hypothetical protein
VDVRFTTSQTNFKAGRLSPKLDNRIDTEQYRAGASILEAARIIAEGGIARSKGYRLLPHTAIEANDDGTDPTSRKFISITIQGVPVLVLLYRDNTNKVTLFTHAYPYSYATSNSNLWEIVPAGSHVYDCRKFDYTVSGNALILVHADGTFAPLYVYFASTGEVALRSGVVPRIEALYSQVANSTPNGNGANVSGPLSATLHGISPMTDVGFNSNPLTIGTWDNVNGQFAVTCPTSTDTVALLQGSRVIYLEGLGNRDFGSGTAQTAVGSCFCTVLSNTTNGVFVRPTFMVTPTNVPILQFLSITTVDQWAVNMFKPNNFPRSVTSHESRVVFGGTPEQPLSFFGSRTSNDTWFNQLRLQQSGTPYLPVPSPNGATIATDPYLFKIATKDDSRIMWIASATNLVIGTDRKEHVVTGGDSIISAFNINTKPYSAKGGDAVSASSIGGAVYYLSGNGKRLYRFKYNDANGSFTSEEVSLLFSDLIEYDKIEEVVWAANLSTLYVRMLSGQLYGIYDDGMGSPAVIDTLMTNVLELAYVQVSSFNEAAIYPKRGDHLVAILEEGGLALLEQTHSETATDEITQAGSGDVEIEITDANAFKYMDHGWQLVPTPSGGNTVWKTANGAAQATYLSSTGAPVPATIFPAGTAIIATNLYTGVTKNFTVGAPTAGFWQIPDADFYGSAVGTLGVMVGKMPRVFQAATMPLEAGQQWGTAQMGIKNIDTIGIRYYKTYSFEFSSNGTNWQDVNVTVDGGKCATGRVDRKYDTRPGTDQIIYIRNAKCEPCCITGINMRGTSNDG